MKILVITPFYYLEGRPDLHDDTNAVYYFTKYWSADHEVKVLNVYPHTYRELKRYANKQNRAFYKRGYRFEKDKIDICIAEVQKLPGQKGRYLNFQCRHIMKIFQKWLKKELFVPDVILVHVPSYAYNFIEKITSYFGTKIPCIGILHETDIDELKRDKRLKELLETRFRALCSRSHGIKRKASLFGLANLQEEIIQSGIPKENGIEKSAPTAIDDGLKIIYVGKLIPRKNADKIIEAISVLNNEHIRLEIVGEGKENESLRALVTKHGLQNQVTFIGKLSREQVILHMADANIFCMPSVAETLGLTYLEAMSVGCVPIGTMGEGIDGIIIDGQNGYLVDPQNIVVDLTRKIQAYMDLSDVDRIQMSNSTKESVKDLDESTCAQHYLDLVRRSVENAREA